MNNLIVTYEQLRENLGGSTPADVAARAEAKGIRVVRGANGRPFTTISALNKALGVGSGTATDVGCDVTVEIC